MGSLVPRFLKKFQRDRSDSPGQAPAARSSAVSGRSAKAGPGEKTFGHAAFDPGDVEDARRGHPSDSLQPFASATGLEFVSPGLEPAFLATLPVHPDYNFNVCRGEFPGGRRGRLGHELLEMSTSEGSIRGGGTFYDVRVTTRRSARDMLNLGDGDPDTAPFAGNAVWIPTTTVHLRTPEVNQLPVLTIGRSGEMLFGGTKLDQFGLPGFRLQRGPKDDHALLGAVGSACGPALSSRRDAYVQLRVKSGIVALTVNGYRHDDEDLRSLVDAACRAAQGFVAITRPATATPLTTPGPKAGTLGRPAGVLTPSSDFVAAYARTADEFSLVHEDPYHFALRVPRCPIPGFASGVLFGVLPGFGAVGRMVWFEDGGKTSGSVRAGVIVPAMAGVVTPLGGVTHAPTGMQVEVIDDVAYCWKLERYVRKLEKLQLGPDAKAAFAATGVRLAAH